MPVTQVKNNVIANNTIAPAKLNVTSSMQTFLSSATSANLATTIADETGSGSLVFATSPTLTTPTIATVNGSTSSNGSITIQGTSNATRTTSNVDLQPSGGGVTIGGTTRNASAIFQINSTTLGFLPPVMTIAQRNAIASPAAGLVVYSSDAFELSFYNGTSWGDVFSSHPASFTSATLAAAVSDETGSGSLVFGTSPTITSPTIATSLTLNATNYTYGAGAREALLNSMSNRFVYKDGLVPFAEIFEDFPTFGNLGATATIGTHGWTFERTAGTGATNSVYTASSDSASYRAWGVISNTTANTINAVNLLRLSTYNGQTASPYGMSIQSCFCVDSTSQAIYYMSFAGGGTNLDLRVNFSNGSIELLRNGQSAIVLVSGLTFSTGNFASGTRYRLFFRPLSTTQTEVYFSSSPWNSSTWTTLVNQVFTHTAYSALGWSSTTPYVGILTLEAVSKTCYVDWVAIRQEIQR